MTKLDLTLEEQEKILLVAEGLIREPESWVEGHWKCQMMVAEPGTGHLIPKTDDNGQQLHQYCIEGAVNQAALEVLGEERVQELHRKDTKGHSHDPERSGMFTDGLGLNKIAWALYHEEMDWEQRHKDRPGLALEVNDSDADGDTLIDDPHASVLTILRTRLKAVQRSLGARRGIRANRS